LANPGSATGQELGLDAANVLCQSSFSLFKIPLLYFLSDVGLHCMHP